MSPKVSVIVPNYNHAPYLRPRLDSIFDQTFQDFEVIILDDCSTDNSKEVIEEYRNRPQVSNIIYNETNSGSPFKQWAKGFDLAKGEYIWIAESDDWAELNFLKTLTSVLDEEPQRVLAFSASFLHDESTEVILKAYDEDTAIDGIGFIKEKMIFGNSIPNASAVLFKKEVLFQINTEYTTFRGAGDCLFWINLCEKGSIYFTKFPLNHFRQHGHSTTKKCLTNGYVFEESLKIKKYLKRKIGLSFLEDTFLTVKKIRHITEVAKTGQLKCDSNETALTISWKTSTPFLCVKRFLLWLYAITQLAQFRLWPSKHSNAIQDCIKNETFFSMTWLIFNLPETNFKNIPKLIKKYAKQIFIYTKRPLTAFDIWASKGRLNWMPDKLYLTLMFRSKMGYWMNWKNPQTFNEKLQWLKIHDRNPLYTKLVDKYEVRKYIAEKIGEEYLIPLLGVWDSVDDIDFGKLPNQFVLKCTHDSGSVIICKDKNNFDIKLAKDKLRQAQKINYYLLSREWPYKAVKPRIIAEVYINDNESSDLNDFKLFCFDGKVSFIQVDLNRFTNHTRNIYNPQWIKQNFEIALPSSKQKVEEPNTLNEMLKLSKELSKGIPHLRCDWYCVKNKLYFGEVTFYHGAGFENFKPNKWDLEWGNMINVNPRF